MQIPVSERMKDFEEGIFQVLNEKKMEVEGQGKKVYNLSVGTPDFETAPHIVEAVVKAAQKPENYKYALADLPQLTEAVIQRFKTRYQVELKAQEIMSVYGSQEELRISACPCLIQVILCLCRTPVIPFLLSDRLLQVPSCAPMN